MHSETNFYFSSFLCSLINMLKRREIMITVTYYSELPFARGNSWADSLNIVCDSLPRIPFFSVSFSLLKALVKFRGLLKEVSDILDTVLVAP